MLQTGKPTLTKEDFQNLLDSIPDQSHLNAKMGAQDWRMFFRVMYGCALRVKETANLRPENFDLEHGILSVPITKNSLEKTTILPHDVSDLKEYLKGLKPDLLIWPISRQSAW